MNNSLYKCPICGGPTNYSSINYQPQPCLHCHATLKPADQQHGNDQHAPPYGTLFDAGKPNEQTTPAPTPWSVKSEAYWHNQYQLMREKYHKQMDENLEQAESINKLEEQLNVMRFLFNQAAKELESEQAAKRELEEHSTKQDFLIDELADSLRAMVAHCEGFISNLKEGR